MGNTLSGIVINRSIKTKDEIEHILNCKISPAENSSSRNKCKIYYLNNSVFIELNNDIPSEPVGVRNGNCVSFVLSGSTDAYSINYCEGNNLLKSFKSLGGERFEEYGSFTESDDDYSLILNLINEVAGEDIYECIDKITPKQFSLEISGIKVNYPEPNDKGVSKKLEIRSSVKEIEINVPADPSSSDKLFNQLLSEEVNEVLGALSEITEPQINTHTITYILVLTRFHVDTRVRREAKKLLKTYSSESLWNQVESAWDDKHRNIQGYHEKKEYYEHPDLDSVQYFLFAYVNRRNFFSLRPVKGMYNVYSSSTANKDEIQNVFECYGDTVNKIPKKIRSLDHIKVAKFNSTINLDLFDAVEHLSFLPNLHNLVLFATKFENLPNNINNLSNLQNLELYENKLGFLPQDMYLPQLNYLGIQYNSITELNFDSFPNLSKLKVDSNYKPGSILFKNVKNAFSIYSGKQIIEKVDPK